MEIIDLSPRHEALYFLCLEDWSDEIREAGDHKRRWYEHLKDRGLRVKLALDENEQVGGMIQYVPVEHSSAEGLGLYFINCIWVHGHKQGRGNFQRRGMGSALLAAAEADVRDLGAQGLAAWGLALPIWMRASWFKKHGYLKADRVGIQSLVWKPFSPDAAAPRWIRRRKKLQPVPGQVTVTAFISGWCPALNLAVERARRAAAEFGERVRFQEISTLERAVRLEWGIGDGVFIDGREVRTGPPPSFEKIRKLIAKKVKRL